MSSEAAILEQVPQILLVVPNIKPIAYAEQPCHSVKFERTYLWVLSVDIFLSLLPLRAVVTLVHVWLSVARSVLESHRPDVLHSLWPLIIFDVPLHL